MTAGGRSPYADAFGIEIVVCGICPKPANCAFAIVDLRWEHGDLAESIFDARHGIAIRHQPNGRTVILAAAEPSATVDPNHQRQWRFGLLRQVKVEEQTMVVEFCVLQIRQLAHARWYSWGLSASRLWLHLRLRFLRSLGEGNW